MKFSFGYNIEAGDDVVIHRHVLLDDRGGIVLSNRVSVADFANIYSHTHDLGDQRDVENKVTYLGDGARVTYHATILGGTRLEADSMVGALAVATRNVAAGEVAVGIPAQPKLRKPPPDERPQHPRTRDPLADDFFIEPADPWVGCAAWARRHVKQVHHSLQRYDALDARRLTVPRTDINH